MKQHIARKKGYVGEEVASDYLENLGYTILQKNFQCKGGEIDIIAQSPQQEIVFVEVKFYEENNWCHPLESITKLKQKRLINAAKFYLLKHQSFNKHCRFDAIVSTSKHSLEHIKDIFHV